MLTKFVKCSFVFVLVFVFLAGSVLTPARAQDTAPDGVTVTADAAVMDAPTLEQVQLLDAPPEPTSEQLALQQWGEQNANRSIDINPTIEGPVAGPMPGTESVVMTPRPRSGGPLAPGDAVAYQWTNYGASIPGGYKSNIMEQSTDGKSRFFFATGNWYAARSADKGRTFSYINPYSDFPSFCCDQVVLEDVNRDITMWFRLGVPDGNGNNVIKLSVSAHDIFGSSYWTYTIAPTNVNAAWTNQWFDYPHMQIGADYLYISMNIFNAAGSWQRTIMLRWPLNEISVGAGFNYNYVTDSTYFTFVPVSGAQHTMYFASNWGNPPYNNLRIWRWYEDSTNLSAWTVTVPAWTPTGRGYMHCGTPNWLDRGDQRLLTGALYKVNNDGIAQPRQTGRNVLGWWWNVAEGGGFTYPYIEGAAFYEDTMTLLPGYLGRPYVYGGWCFAYPSFTPNIRGDLGGLFNFSTSPNYQIPNVAITIADEYWQAPPGWAVYGQAGGSGGSSSATWGDYNTTRTFQLGTTWVSGSHYIPTAGNCSNCAVPLWMGFGRERDGTNFRWW